MLEIFNKWYRRYLFEEESVLLLVLLVGAVALAIARELKLLPGMRAGAAPKPPSDALVVAVPPAP